MVFDLLVWDACEIVIDCLVAIYVSYVDFVLIAAWISPLFDLFAYLRSKIPSALPLTPFTPHQKLRFFIFFINGTMDFLVDFCYRFL
jgi:hypothetical protein